MRPVLLTIIWIAASLAATKAPAGAWPRDAGSGFASASSIHSINGGGNLHSWIGVYAEYGIRPRLTFGLDGDLRSGDGHWSSWAFLRWDLAPGATVKRAASFGLGVRRTATGIEMVVRPGLSIGRGIETPWGHGWMVAEAQAIHAPASGWTAWKLDGTFGIKPSPGRLMIMQVQTSLYPEGGLQVRLQPSLVQRIRPGVHVEIGLAADLMAPRSIGLKIGTWLEF